jgi:ribose 5-phosphate isomerase B
MKIYLAADHGGFHLKEKIKAMLVEADFWSEKRSTNNSTSDIELVDCGAHQLDPQDDYPNFIIPLAQAIQADPTHTARGIICCRSGTGVTIVANKVPGIRAGNCFSPRHVQLAVAHNRINVLAIPADYLPEQEIIPLLQAFFTTAPDQNPRHLRRLAKITQLEQDLRLCK